MERIELKDYLRETNLIHSRLFALVCLLIVLSFILLARVWYLQVYSNERFEVLSKDNRVRLVPEPPVRGLIYDRNGKVLAENIPVFTLEILPDEVENMDVLLNELAKLVQISPKEISKFKSLVRARPNFESQVLKLNLSEEEVARFVINKHHLKGASVEARLQRNYPYGGELVHVLGYVGRINKRDLDKIDSKAYQGTEYIGKSGIEAKYEDDLLGKVGFEQVEKNAHGQLVRSLDRKPSVSGSDIYLNIDADLQVKAREYLDGQRGSVVAIEPQTGQVLAFVSNPVYDPNKFVNGIDYRSYNALLNDPYRPLVNRAFNGRYAPGSTIKGLVSLAGLENGWDQSTNVTCPGYFKLKGSSHRYRCWKRHGHGLTGLAESIMQSCDVFYYQLSNWLGIDRLHDFLAEFGIGERTGIDLNGEPTGLNPSRQWKRNIHGTPWYPGETLNAGIGQGHLLVTPTQLAVMTATLSNKGKRIEPRLVNRLVTGFEGEGQEQVEFKNGAVLGEASMNPYNVSLIVEAMRRVVEDPKGTARRAWSGAPYSTAGKTGTVQVVSIAQGARYDESILTEFQKDHALFIAFAPIEDPKIAISVVVENGGGGSSVAAPIARKVMDFYLLGVDANAPEIVEPETGQADLDSSDLRLSVPVTNDAGASSANDTEGDR